MPIISTCLTLIVIITCLTLANWQHHRAQDKQQRLDNISAIQAQGLMSWHELSQLPKRVNKTGIKLQLTGQFQSKEYWLLDNRVFQQQVGFDVLTIFKPAQSKQAFIVNLGWVKAPKSRDQYAQVKLPTDNITLKIQLKQGDLAGFYLQTQQPNNSGWPKRIQYIDLASMQQESGRQFLGFMGYSSEKMFALQPHYQPVVMPPEKHLAYALQWLLLAIAALLVFVFAVKPFTRQSPSQGDPLE
jgi:cytochrome oxidase assembly protein ShyY1